MFRIAIVEDEKVYAQELCVLIAECLVDADIRIYESGEALLREESTLFDCIFIDIELPGVNGLILAKHLRENGYANMLVFTTNYEQFVYDGYEVEAFRYLLKPVKKAALLPCLERMKQNAQARSLKFSFNRKMHSIPFADILYFSSNGHYLCIHTKEREFEWKFSFKELLPLLPQQFVRCHRSFVVNIDYIRKLDVKRIVLKNNEEIDVSDGFLQEIRGALSSLV